MGAVMTLTVTVDIPVEPPWPVQTRAYTAVLVRLVSDCDPDVALVPLHPPDAVQEVAFALLQVSVADPPEVTDDALAARVTVGAGIVTEKDPVVVIDVLPAVS